MIKLLCQKVGADEFGNEYFQNKKGKRFVVYNGIAEASKIPAQWHGWIHYTAKNPPVKIDTHKASWEKIHVPNLTGTKGAYSPMKYKTPKTSAQYEAWEPK